MNTERMKKANACHDRGFNCSQSVLAAFADVTGLSQEESNSSNCITTTCVQLRVGWILTGYRNRCRWVSTTVTTYMQRVGMNTCVTVLV